MPLLALLLILVVFGMLMYLRIHGTPNTASFELLHASETARKPDTPFEAAEFQSADAQPQAPQPLSEHASRSDLVQFAKEHAAYYAAQGVPEHEAMLYISNKVRDVVAMQQKQQEAREAARAARPAVPVVRPATAPPEPPMPLVMKLTGTVPLAGHAAEPTEPSGRRKKVSSESKEVEEYMRRRQSALGIDAPDEPPTAAHTSSVSFQDPFETML